MTKRPDAGPNHRIHGKAYQGAMEAVFAIPVGLGLGYLGDRSFGTYPTWLLVGGVVGFSAFVLRLVRLGREVQPTETEPERPGSGPREGK